MESRWSDQEAKALVARHRERFAALHGDTFAEDIALRVYSSQLIGRDPALVLHGGGNTSVKTLMRDDLGKLVDVLCVKGSGWDLAHIEPEGLPAVRLHALQELRKLESLSDEAMVNAQRTRMLDSSAPNPSIETLLHAFLPHRFIDHSHADAILSLVDQPRAEEICRERFGRRFGIVPYVMPGFALSKLAAEVYEKHPDVEGLLLLQHGLFTFGDTARESYERHIAAVQTAADFTQRRRYWSSRDSMPPVEPIAYSALAPTLRGRLGAAEGKRYVLHLRRSAEILDFVCDPRVTTLSQQGPATPDHVIRTKRLPLVLKLEHGLDEAALAPAIDAALSSYREAYRDYVARQQEQKGIVVTPLDPDPRVVLVHGLGLVAVGETERAARIAADVYEHTISVIRAAEAVERYQALPEADLFDMEYWSLEQAKLGRRAPPPLAGQVVAITGAASGIGAATARCFAKAGAHLLLLDRDEAPLSELADALDAEYARVDVASEAALRTALDAAVRRFGGLDGVVSNAGIAPQAPIADCDTGTLRRSFDVNFYAHHVLASAATAVMRRQGRGGFLLFNASKAAFNPGAGFGPYAIAKAALVALMRQYALEGGADGIRASAINADRVRTGLLPPEMVQARAAARGIEPDDYFRANLLQREVSADDVAEGFLSLALSPSTTGAVLTVDGGNIAAAPR